MKSRPKLKVGLVFDDSLDTSDGVAQYVKSLGTWLDSQGYTVRYLVGQTEATSWMHGTIYSLARNIRVTFNGNRVSIPLPANKKRIKEVLAKEKFDVLHVMMPYSPFMAQKVIRSAGPEVAIVGTFHIFPAGWLPRFGARILRLMYGLGLRRFDRVVSVSPPAAQFAKQAFGLNTEVVPNPVDIRRFKSGKKPTAARPMVVFLGRLVRRKGCGELLEAFATLSQKMPDVRLTVAGAGPEKQKLIRLASRLGISDKVTFLGFIDEADKPALLAGATVACFPSLYGESFGIVLIEAMAAGAEVVLAGDNPGYRSVLGAQPELLINPKDTAAFAGRLEKLLTNHQLAAQLNRWQQNEVKKYDIPVVGGQILDMYNKAIAHADKKSHNNPYGS